MLGLQASHASLESFLEVLAQEVFAHEMPAPALEVVSPTEITTATLEASVSATQWPE